MDYEEKDTKPLTASEAAAIYEPAIKTVRKAEIEEACLTLQESKRLVLDMVHKHFHSKS